MSDAEVEGEEPYVEYLQPVFMVLMNAIKLGLKMPFQQPDPSRD